MKPSDKIILESLRKGECSHISEVQWSLVEKAVTDAGDVRNVTGMAQTIIFDAIRKGRFSSRSEAGRYAANMRWRGSNAGGLSAAKEKAEADARAGRGAGRNEDLYGRPLAGSKQKYDFSQNDYKMVREAVPQLSASDAKKLTQYLLDNNAFGDTSEMSLEEMGREFRMYLDDALGGGDSGAKNNTKDALSQYKATPIKPEKSNFQGGKQLNVTTTAATLDKLFGKGNYIEPGSKRDDPAERKVTEEWMAKITDKKTGKTFEIQIWDWMRYDDAGMSQDEGKKIGRIKRDESFDFSVGTMASGGAKIVQEMILAAESNL